MIPTLFWLAVTLGFLLPLAHVALSPKSGPWAPPPGAGCPIGPRLGWIVLILFLGPIGWLLYLRARRSRPESRQDLKKDWAPER